MKIAIGVNRTDEVGSLVDAGADEFYAGIVPESWSKRYGYAVSPNRRESERPNLTSFQDLAALCAAVHRGGRQIFVTVNAHDYPAEVLGDIRNLIREALGGGADGIIIADPGLLLKLKQWRIRTRIILSGDFGITSSRSLDWVRDLDLVQRVIFPRQTTTPQMQRIIERHPAFEYEAFVMNERCFFSGAHCYSIHGKSPQNFCIDVYNRTWGISADETFSYAEYKTALENIFQVKLREQAGATCNLNDGKPYNAVPCAMCHVGKLKKLGVACLKIVSRGVEPGLKLTMLKLVRRVLDEQPEPTRIIDWFGNTFSNYFKEMCASGINCYNIDPDRD